MQKPASDRQQLRQVVVECSALVDRLNTLYPLTKLPDLNATDREIGEWLGQRRLIERLNNLRREATESAEGRLPDVAGDRR